MPHTRKSSNGQPAWRPGEFISVSLTPDDIARIKATPLDAERIDDSLTALIHDGYKVSVKHDQMHQCYACYVVGPEQGVNRGAILTGRGSTPMKAMRQALYIHHVVLEGDWPNVNERARGEIDD